MDEPMTHERCSELLRGYAGGELPREVADDVRAHLAACEECRVEERAVAVLFATGTADAQPLDDLERARLHRGLAQELFTPRATSHTAGFAAPERRWVRWLVPATAAAAVLAGVLVMTLGGGVNDSASNTAIAPAAEDGGADSEGLEDSSSGRGKGKGSRSSALSAQSGGGAAPDAEADYGAPENPRPAFDPDRGVITTSELYEIGRGHLFRSFADAYRPAEAPDLYDEFLEVLAAEAIGLGPQIEECAATVPEDSVVPTYATVGEYDGRRAFVLGFVTSDPGSSTLDRYLILVWELDDCGQPIDTLSERIGRG